jgi:hypothetical protein
MENLRRAMLLSRRSVRAHQSFKPISLGFLVASACC